MSARAISTRPSFSVVIPTYNRADYLRFTLDTCLAQRYPLVEFIVKDDNSTDHTKQVAEHYAKLDPRFRYVNPGYNSGMRGNFESSLDNTNGEYLIFLGGDDALLPEAFEDLEKAISRHPGKIITWAVAGYHYDQARNGSGQISVPQSTFRRHFETEITSDSYFREQCEKLFYVSDEKSPMIYVKSAVPRKLIDEARERSGGVFFSSSTPDGYSGFALASVVQSYIFTNKPYTMHGVSPSSAGLNYVMGKKDKDDHSSKFFAESKAVPMAPQLASQPYSPLISLMTADFIFQTDNVFRHGYSAHLCFENIINKALRELCNGLYSENKIERELKIIGEIAAMHGKSDFLRSRTSSMRRDMTRIVTGDLISPQMFILSAPERNIHDVGQASEFLFKYRNRQRVYARLRWPEAIFNSLKYKLNSYRKSKYLSSYL